MPNNNDNQTEFILQDLSNSEKEVQESKPLLSKGLKYKNLINISFWFFLVESLSFTINYIFDRVSIIFSFAMFNLNRDQKSPEIIGFAYTWSGFYFMVTRDFQEPIGIICGAFYSKGDFYQYTLSKYRLLISNVVLICLNFAVFVITLPWLFKLIHISPQNMDLYIRETIYLAFFYVCCESATNFIRGKALWLRGIELDN